MKARGFTLIELLVSVAILAVLASLAMPAFTTIVANARVRSAADQLRDLVGRARQEALKRNLPVTVTAASNVVTLSIPPFGGSTALQLSQFSSTATISDGAVTLNGSGRASAATSFAISAPDLACKADQGPVTCYAVQVFQGGAARLCDPTMTAGNAKACL